MGKRKKSSFSHMIRHTDRIRRYNNKLYILRYKEQYVETMQGLVEFAQEAYNNRQHEIKLFKDLVDAALEDSVLRSKEYVFIYYF